ncbi:DNA polymerase I [Thalassoroseus pseudoceratinae]|uniref:DNA polymerase I n=1 Tax=Thalassoroseus pseudoceratinae TaxID=2713176 RepID=UPI00142487D9|nr:DNA polymerase I [Thalassoroseus pseudoceratinae]
MPDTVYLVDTFSLMFQVFHAIRQPMTGSEGLPTNAVFGFTRDLKHLIEEVAPSHLICAFESDEPGTRKTVYADYKANRAEMPADLQPQVPIIKELIEAMNVPLFHHPGWEADDVIATLARQAVEDGMEVRIVSSDKDHRQLLGPHVQMYNIRKREFFDEAALMDTWGIRPNQVIDFQSLVGDSVDNVPGVPKIGPKTATNLLAEYETLDAVLENAANVKGKVVSKNLQEFRDQALVSRELVTLNTQLPLDFDWNAARVGEPDRERLLPLFERLAFKRYAEEIRKLPKSKSQPSLFPEESDRNWETVDTPAKWEKFLKQLRKQKKFCVDLETTGLDAMQADIVGWALSWEAGMGWYVPVDGPEGQAKLDPKTVVDALQPLLEDPNIEIVNQNLKYDMLVLKRIGVEVHGIGVDPMVGDYLLDAGARSHGLDALASRYLNQQMISITELIGSGKKQKSMAEIDIKKVAEYASEDADIAWQLAEQISDALHEEKLHDLYDTLECPLIPVLAQMEFHGVRVDVTELQRQSEELTTRLDELEQEIYSLAGREFNIASPKQLSVVLFDEIGLPVLKKTKTGPSTSADVLEELAIQHDLPALIIEHRQLAKLKGTYLDALPELVNPVTGNIHTSFNQVVAATGRLSSSDPNLQNIPIRTDEGRRVRRAFVPSEPGWKLVCADYSQIELRVLAHFSDDPAMTKTFAEGLDIHTAVAAEIFGVPLDEVDSNMRRVAKGVNFGVLYGQSAFGLAAALRIPRDEAQVFIDSYFDKYPGVERHMEQILEEVQRTGYATTILGRRRRVEGIRRITGRQRNVSERTAINTVIQGSAADMIKRAMIAVHNRLAEENHPARMLLQIHDELIFESPVDDVDSLIEIVQTEMKQAIELRVPLVVDVKIGENWLDAD